MTEKFFFGASLSSNGILFCQNVFKTVQAYIQWPQYVCVCVWGGSRSSLHISVNLLFSHYCCFVFKAFIRSLTVKKCQDIRGETGVGDGLCDVSGLILLIRQLLIFQSHMLVFSGFNYPF